MVEGRELDLKFCKKNLGNQRSEDFGNCQGEGREENASLAEVKKWNTTHEEKQKK